MASSQRSQLQNVLNQLIKRMNWLIFFGVIFALGAFFDFKTSVGIQPQFSVTKIPDVNDPNKTVGITLVTFPPHYYVLKILSNGLYSLSTSLFISVFVISILESIRIRDEQQK